MSTLARIAVGSRVKISPYKAVCNLLTFCLYQNEEETSFLQEFYNFKIENGIEVEKIKSPVWCGKKIDLYKIFEAVNSHGGYTEVNLFTL